MCHSHTQSQHNPLHCILPPYILENIARNGNAQQREYAIETLSVDSTMRSLRAMRSMSVEASPRPRIAEFAATYKANRTIYNTRNSTNQPGKAVRHEGDKPKANDPAVNEAYDGLGAIFDFYAELFDRNSIDDKGLPLNAIVHYNQNYNNAFWDGYYMVFGDGDGKVFNRFTVALDVIGHELTHGVTEFEAGLLYQGQPGALNEHVSDVFGSLIKQRKLNQTANKADWLIGTGLLTKKIKGMALRSMKAPGTAFDDPLLGKDQQPAHMKDYVETMKDHGGVHINSGIPNRAFYLAATAIGGNAWDKAGRVWYETLRHPKLRPGTRFSGFAKLTTSTAARMFGAGSVDYKAVQDAWKQVGVL